MIERLLIHPVELEARKRSVSGWHIPARVQADVLRFLQELELGRVNRGRRISPRRQLKYLGGLKVPLEFFNKPVEKITLRDMEKFEKALCSGALGAKVKARAYAHSTQVDFRKILRIFLRWRLGDTRARPLTDWLDTRYRLKTPDYLKDLEIEKLYRHCKTAEQRYLVAMLFDSGARAEEFHNVRFEDIHLPEGKEAFVKIVLKEEYSKTLGRTISLYWKHSADAVREYLAHRVTEGVKPHEPVFSRRYEAASKFLRRLGRQILKRRVHYHLFRHSSATYYATRMNRQELCYRYGWRFRSNMPDIYISRAGMETKDLDAKFTQTELSGLKDELTALQQTARIKDERIHELENAVKAMQQGLQTVTKILELNPPIAEVQAALRRRRSTLL